MSTDPTWLDGDREAAAAELTRMAQDHQLGDHGVAAPLESAAKGRDTASLPAAPCPWCGGYGDVKLPKLGTRVPCDRCNGSGSATVAGIDTGGETGDTGLRERIASQLATAMGLLDNPEPGRLADAVMGVVGPEVVRRWEQGRRHGIRQAHRPHKARVRELEEQADADAEIAAGNSEAWDAKCAHVRELEARFENARTIAHGALNRLAAVRELHVVRRGSKCEACLITHPCPTLRAVDAPADPDARHRCGHAVAGVGGVVLVCDLPPHLGDAHEAADGTTWEPRDCDRTDGSS